jgi:hypothetical protein
MFLGSGGTMVAIQHIPKNQQADSSAQSEPEASTFSFTFLIIECSCRRSSEFKLMCTKT